MNLASYLEAAALRTPSAVAVRMGAAVLSYAALAGMVRGLHARLRAMGVGPGHRVALVADRSLEAIVAVYGVLRAGGTLVPVEPGLPPARLAQVLADASPSVILHTGARRVLAALRQSDCTVPLVHVVGEGEEDAAGLEIAQMDPGADGLMLYTSGSTGGPKAVRLSVRAVHAFVNWSAKRVLLTQEDVVAHLSPLSFDLFTFEIFAPAVVGATIQVVPPAATQAPASLVDALAGCSLVYTVPAVWMRLLAGDLAPLRHGPLRRIVYAGEAFPVPALVALMAAIPNRTVENWFGPTETNVCCAYVFDAPPVEAVPIGFAASEAQLWIQPDGELWVAGPTVMNGYWGRPELDAQAFAEARGTRWLRTGDYVRVDEHGRMFALGRRDSQLKHRGFRIQPEEIEAALEQEEGVADCVVFKKDDQLVGYVVSVFGVVLDEKGLRRRVGQRLPAWMVPDVLTVVDDLPRSARGKRIRPV